MILDNAWGEPARKAGYGGRCPNNDEEQKSREDCKRNEQNVRKFENLWKHNLLFVFKDTSNEEMEDING